MQSIGENEFEGLANTEVNTPKTIFPNRTRVNLDVPQADSSFITPPRGGFLHLGETVISNGVAHLKAGDGAENQF